MAGLSFALPQIFVAKYLGAELPAIVGSVVCMAVVIGMAKIFYKDTAAKNAEKIPFKTAIMAWLPFILVFVIIILCSSLFPMINGALKQCEYDDSDLYRSPRETDDLLLAGHSRNPDHLCHLFIRIDSRGLNLARFPRS